MADVVYLHVGAPKTGTTYLQTRLHRNRRTLAEHGVGYPSGNQPDMFAAALDLTGMRWEGEERTAQGQWAALVRRIGRTPGTAVVSHELLSTAGPEQAARAWADLEGVETHLVYSTRDLARQIPAQWQESLKYRRRSPLRRYAKAVRRAGRRPATSTFWRFHSLPDVIDRWGQGLPPERIHLVVSPQAGAPRDELWRRYCTALGIDPAWAPLDTDQSNASLGVEEVAVLRELNRRVRRRLDPEDYRTLVRGVVVEALAQRSDMRPVTLPVKHHRWAGSVAQEWVDWITSSGVHVVGDPEELRPAALPTEPGRRRRRPRTRLLAEATTDALTAVVLEAASRPDPEQSAAARLGRVASRLRGT